MNELANLEREVEMARARLAGNLSTLVSTDTYSELKEDVKDEARSALAKMVENLKARAAANPAAALAIGAGLHVAITAAPAHHRSPDRRWGNQLIADDAD